jgi:hypothetical protein
MVTSDKVFLVRDLLRDSVANFDLKQSELAWTAIAYAIYLPPNLSWTNRFGETFLFDDIAAALIATPLNRASCGGLHLLVALATIAQIDESNNCLSASVRESLMATLIRYSTLAARVQKNDGSWGTSWHHSEDRIPVVTTALPYDRDSHSVTTSHMLEFLLVLPTVLQPPDDVYRKAAQWLAIDFAGVPAIHDQSRYCPYVHAVCAIQALVSR